MQNGGSFCGRIEGPLPSGHSSGAVTIAAASSPDKARERRPHNICASVALGARVRPGDHRGEYALQHRRGSSEVAFADGRPEVIRPVALGGLDRGEDVAAARRQLEELRPAMSRIVLLDRETVALEEVCHALDALPRQPKSAGDLCDAGRGVLDCGHDLPAGARLPGRTGEGVAGRREESV